MTIKDTVRKYSQKLKYVTHIPAKEIEILVRANPTPRAWSYQPLTVDSMTRCSSFYSTN